MVLEQLASHMQKKMNLNIDLPPFTKINLKWTINQNVKYKSVVLEDNIREDWDDLVYGDDFLKMYFYCIFSITI